MKRLPPDRRNKLIAVVAATLGLISLVYFFLIGPQKELNEKLAAGTATDLARLQQIKQSVKQSAATADKLTEINELLAHAEDDEATGDVFAWTYDTIRQFKNSRHVDITSIGQPIQSDVDMVPNCPYKQIKFEIMGTGYFHDIGKFIADLENKFPHMRIVNMVLESGNGSETQSEKLSFRMEIAALVKPNT
jgi:Tfp pilus assembly protein PilO